MTVTTRASDTRHRATAPEREGMQIQRASVRRDLAAGWLDQLHATPAQDRVRLIRRDLPAPLRGEREVEATVAHHACHPLADCWTGHAPGAAVRRYAATWAAAHGMVLAYVVPHPADATLWLAYMARPTLEGTT